MGFLFTVLGIVFAFAFVIYDNHLQTERRLEEENRRLREENYNLRK